MRDRVTPVRSERGQAGSEVAERVDRHGPATAVEGGPTPPEPSLRLDDVTQEVAEVRDVEEERTQSPRRAEPHGLHQKSARLHAGGPDGGVRRETGGVHGRADPTHPDLLREPAAPDVDELGVEDNPRPGLPPEVDPPATIGRPVPIPDVQRAAVERDRIVSSVTDAVWGDQCPGEVGIVSIWAASWHPLKATRAAQSGPTRHGRSADSSSARPRRGAECVTGAPASEGQVVERLDMADRSRCGRCGDRLDLSRRLLDEEASSL